MAWKLKGCHRCGGDVFMDKDGVQECLQCGDTYDPRKRIPIQEYGRHSNPIQSSMSGRYKAIAQPVSYLDLLVTGGS